MLTEPPPTGILCAGVIFLARQPRHHSESGIYHIMLRGIDRQAIFLDDEDRERFLLTLQLCKEISNFQLYAYCLMGNHIHLLLRVMTEGESLEQIFKRIGVRYVAWYNRKYGRTGHLFQDRFLSEPVDAEAYLWTVLPYIHQNPVKAGICHFPEEYPWSSYREYLCQEEGFCDCGTILDWLSENRDAAIEQIRQLHKKQMDAPCLDMEQRKPSDREIQEYLLKICGTSKITELQSLSSSERDRTIQELKKKRASLRQISRLTGWPVGIVRAR